MTIILSTLTVIGGGFLFLWPNIQSDPKQEIKKYMETLAVSDTLYIPSSEDCHYYFEKDNNNKPYPYFDNYFSQIEAIYGIRNIPERCIREMMNSSSAGLNVWGYVLCLRNMHDISFDYLLRSFERDDTLFLVAEDHLLWGECRVRNILLWVALGGFNSPKLLQPPSYWAYNAFGLTDGQIAVLKTKYNEKPEINSDMDLLIRELFEPETRHHFKEMMNKVPASSGM